MMLARPIHSLFVATAAAATLAGCFSARAAQDSATVADRLALQPPEWDFGDWEIRLGGFAGGALFRAWQESGPAFPGGYDSTRVSGEARANIRAQRTLDNGMVLGMRSDFLVYHDRLSGDVYDNDTVEKLCLFAQTGFGRIEIGQQDGASYTLALTGPSIDQQVSVESRNISLFRNPLTGRDFAQFFKQVTAVQSSSNYAKLNYVSPRLLGIQIGAAFTPETVRTPLPWTGNPKNDPDQQQNIWELAASYTGYFSNVALGLSAGFAHGSRTYSTSGGADLYDWALGAQLAYTLSDIKLSLGGSYRGTDAYLLHVGEVLRGAKTHGIHLSATAEKGSWRLGAEYSNADVGGPVDYEVTGFEAALAYKINDNLELTAGWQWYDYARNAGIFYNGRPVMSMNAGFLSFGYAL
jgi:hypothetical protein